MIRTYHDKMYQPTTVKGPDRAHPFTGKPISGSMTFPPEVSFEVVVSKCASRWGNGEAVRKGNQWIWRLTDEHDR